MIVDDLFESGYAGNTERAVARHMKPMQQGVAENFDGEYDDEAGMAHTNLITIARAAKGLLDTIDQHENLPEWVQEKIAKVQGMLVTAWDYLKSQEAQGIDPRITEVFGHLKEDWQRVSHRLELVEEFDLIESIVESIARRNGVDAEVVWADLESLTEDELYVFAVTSEPIMEDWQKANKKDKTDGMSQKAVNAYRREHPGSKLKTAVTTKPSKLKKGSKASKRRKSYCSRSRGQMKMHSISCSKTPDKAICKARRRWNCEGVEPKSNMLKEFAPDHSGNSGEEDILRKYAKMWWAGDYDTQVKIEKALDRMGWEIGQDEGGYDNGGVFVVRAGDENGDSYISWSAEDLTEMDSQGYTGSRDHKRTSKYGSRDDYELGGPEVTLGADSIAKPKDVAKKGADALNRAMRGAHPDYSKHEKKLIGKMSNAEKVNKGWRNPNIDEQGVAEGSEFGAYYYEQLAQQVFDTNPNLTDENEILNLGYKIAKGELGSRAQGMFRDEDFPSDFVTAYGYLKKQGVAEEAKHGLYYNVNKRKAAGTSRPASSPKAPTAQAWKDAAKTAKKEGVAESISSMINAATSRNDLRQIRNFVTEHVKNTDQQKQIMEQATRIVAVRRREHAAKTAT